MCSCDIADRQKRKIVFMHWSNFYLSVFLYFDMRLNSFRQTFISLPFVESVYVEYLFVLYHYWIKQHVLNLGYNLSWRISLDLNDFYKYAKRKQHRKFSSRKQNLISLRHRIWSFYLMSSIILNHIIDLFVRDQWDNPGIFHGIINHDNYLLNDEVHRNYMFPMLWKKNNIYSFVLEKKKNFTWDIFEESFERLIMIVKVHK
jgi:hypothetical protein